MDENLAHSMRALDLYTDIRESYFAPIDLSYHASETHALSEAARDSLARYLTEFPWSFWFTATSGTFLRYPRQAIRMALNELSCVDRGFVGAERHRLGSWHTHGLVYTSVDPGASEGVRVLFERRLSEHGFCRVEPIRKAEAVSRYVAKYITKDLDSDWEIWGKVGWLQDRY